MVELLETTPEKLLMLAVICITPCPVDVTKPVGLTVATSAEVVDQVT
jgi:hypothetical protein